MRGLDSQGGADLISMLFEGTPQQVSTPSLKGGPGRMHEGKRRGSACRGLSYVLVWKSALPVKNVDACPGSFQGSCASFRICVACCREVCGPVQHS